MIKLDYPKLRQGWRLRFLLAKWLPIIAWRAARKGLYIFRDAPVEIVVIYAHWGEQDDPQSALLENEITQAVAEVKTRVQMMQKIDDELAALPEDITAEEARIVELAMIQRVHLTHYGVPKGPKKKTKK